MGELAPASPLPCSTVKPEIFPYKVLAMLETKPFLSSSPDTVEIAPVCNPADSIPRATFAESASIAVRACIVPKMLDMAHVIKRLLPIDLYFIRFSILA